MLDKMIDDASRKMALVMASKGRAAGLTRTTAFEPWPLLATTAGAHLDLVG
jgi:hypothetical protein